MNFRVVIGFICIIASVFPLIAYHIFKSKVIEKYLVNPNYQMGKKEKQVMTKLEEKDMNTIFQVNKIFGIYYCILIPLVILFGML